MAIGRSARWVVSVLVLITVGGVLLSSSLLHDDRDGTEGDKAAAAASLASPSSRRAEDHNDRFGTLDLVKSLMNPCAVEYFESNFRHWERQRDADIDRRASLHEAAGVDHVYMVHYHPPGNERAQKRYERMERILGAHNMSADYVLGFNKEDFTPPMISCLIEKWEPSKYTGLKVERKQPRDRLKPAQRSVLIKHHSALYDMARRQFASALILEDDALLRTRFVQRLKVVMADVPRPYDLVWVGGCIKMHAYRAKYRATRLTKHVYAKQEARCAHAYVVSQNGAQKLLQGYPFTLAIDFQITAAMVESNLLSYWIEPFLSVQGDFGNCTTGDELGAKCINVEREGFAKYFNESYAADDSVDSRWSDVPLYQSKRRR